MCTRIQNLAVHKGEGAMPKEQMILFWHVDFKEKLDGLGGGSKIII